MSAEEQVEALAKVLGEHPTWERGPAYNTQQCAGCGQVAVLGYNRPAYVHAAHVAQVLASLLDEARAEGRREALDEAVEAIRAMGRRNHAAARVVAALGEEGR